MGKTIKFFLMLSFCVLAALSPVLAQSNTGRLLGTISDASGIIPERPSSLQTTIPARSER